MKMPSNTPAKFQIVRTRNKEFRARIVGLNGEKVFVSETYKRRASAMKAISGVVALRETSRVVVEDLTGPRRVVSFL